MNEVVHQDLFNAIGNIIHNIIGGALNGYVLAKPEIAEHVNGKNLHVYDLKQGETELDFYVELPGTVCDRCDCGRPLAMPFTYNPDLWLEDPQHIELLQEIAVAAFNNLVEHDFPLKEE